jgi:hypothetical protein
VLAKKVVVFGRREVVRHHPFIVEDELGKPNLPKREGLQSINVQEQGFWLFLLLLGDAKGELLAFKENDKPSE